MILYLNIIYHNYDQMYKFSNISVAFFGLSYLKIDPLKNRCPFMFRLYRFRIGFKPSLFALFSLDFEHEPYRIAFKNGPFFDYFKEKRIYIK